MSRFWMLVACSSILALQTSCGTVKRTKKKIETALEVVDRTEKLARGDSSQVLPLCLLVLNASQDMAVVHQDQNVLVCELRRIPGLGIKLPSSERKRYHLRIDLATLEQDTHLVLTYFRSDKGDYEKREPPDGFIAQTAGRLFSEIVAALLKSGLVFE